MTTAKNSIVRASALLMLGLATAGNASAASLSYVLDQSGSMADNVGYLQVTISDGLDGAIDFAVRLSSPCAKSPVTGLASRSSASTSRRAPARGRWTSPAFRTGGAP